MRKLFGKQENAQPLKNIFRIGSFKKKKKSRKKLSFTLKLNYPDLANNAVKIFSSSSILHFFFPRESIQNVFNNLL